MLLNMEGFFLGDPFFSFLFLMLYKEVVFARKGGSVSIVLGILIILGIFFIRLNAEARVCIESSVFYFGF